MQERAARVLSQIKGINNDVKLVVELASDWQRAGEWSKAESAWLTAAKLEHQYYWRVAQIDM